MIAPPPPAPRIIAPPPVTPPTNGAAAPASPPPRAPAAPTVDLDSLFAAGGDAKRGFFISIAGPPKYGKTTFAAGAPNPAFIMADRKGLESLPRYVRRAVPRSWTEILAALAALERAATPPGTVVLDTTFAAEAMAIRHLCEKGGRESLRAVGGGYGAGPDMLAAEINKVVAAFFNLNERGIHTIAISQIDAKTVKDPTLDDYERTALALEKKTSLLWNASADVNMYVQPEIRERDRIKGTGDKEDRVKVDFTGRAICHVRPAAGIEAGNRLFLDSPITYSWAALEIGAEEGAELRDRLFAKLATLDIRARAAADWRLNQAGWSRAAAEIEINGAGE